MSKAQVFAFYRQSYVAIGGDADGITGHSARVTGARALAFAGNATPVVQLFGRWGGPTVYAYIRDALLGREGCNVRQANYAAQKLDKGIACADVAQRFEDRIK